MNSCFCGKKKNEQEKVVVRKKEGVGGSPLLLLPFSSSLGAHLMLPKTLSAFQYPFTNRKECYMTTIPCLHLEKPLEYVLTTLVTPFFDLFAYLSVFTFRLFFSLFSWEFPKLLPFFFLQEMWKTGFAVQFGRRRRRTWAPPPRLLAAVNNASISVCYNNKEKRESIFTKLEAVMAINHFS